jgi:polar amino acid transport system permease protein
MSEKGKPGIGHWGDGRTGPERPPRRAIGARILHLLALPSPHVLPRNAFSPGSAAILGFSFIALLAFSEAYAQVAVARDHAGILETIWKWLPLILFGTLDVQFGGPQGIAINGQLGGFALNILVSFMVMAIGTVLGVILGLILVSRGRIIRALAWALMQFFRNSPWLVMLFFAVLLLPFQIKIFGFVIPFPDWAKATVALSLPIMANIAEITRGAIQSIPTSQWESAESLAFGRAQTFRLIILPQCVKRMTPPWMNWYAILAMESSLISIVGVQDAMTLTHDALASENRTELLIPMYGLLLALFFVYTYPIARWTQMLEKRFSVKG